MTREANAPVVEIDDHRGTRRVIELAPPPEDALAEAAEHLAQAQYHWEKAEELLAPLNRVAAYRHEAEMAVDEALKEDER